MSSAEVVDTVESQSTSLEHVASDPLPLRVEADRAAGPTAAPLDASPELIDGAAGSEPDAFDPAARAGQWASTPNEEHTASELAGSDAQSLEQ
jgi:hypothetical protein